MFPIEFISRKNKSKPLEFKYEKWYSLGVLVQDIVSMFLVYFFALNAMMQWKFHSKFGFVQNPNPNTCWIIVSCIHSHFIQSGDDDGGGGGDGYAVFLFSSFHSAQFFFLFSIGSTKCELNGTWKPAILVLEQFHA